MRLARLGVSFSMLRSMEFCFLRATPGHTFGPVDILQGIANETSSAIALLRPGAAPPSLLAPAADAHGGLPKADTGAGSYPARPDVAPAAAASSPRLSRFCTSHAFRELVVHLCRRLPGRSPCGDQASRHRSSAATVLLIGPAVLRSRQSRVAGGVFLLSYGLYATALA